MPRTSTGRLVVATVVLLACLWYILTTFIWRDIWEQLRSTDLALLIFGGGLSIIVQWLLRTLRWQMLLAGMGKKSRYGPLYWYSALAQGFSLITPFQSGEMIKVELLKKHQHTSRPIGYASFVVEKLLDIAAVLTLAAIGIPTFFLSEREFGFWPVLSLLFIGVILLSIMLLKSGLLSRLRHDALLYPLKTLLTHGYVIVLTFLITLMAWIATSIGWMLSLSSAGLVIGMYESIGLTGLSTAINIASMIPGAIGVSEAGITELLMSIEFPAAQAQTGAIILRVYGLYIIMLSVMHLLIWGMRHTIPPLEPD